ncbi:MAG: glycosyltransferase family 4 protein [Candidatus Woesearchaeota archaeon]
MKILIINSRYFLSAGPEKYMFSLIDILEKKGHKVVIFSTKNIKNQKSIYEDYFVSSIGGDDKVYFEEYKKTPKTIYQILERQFYSFEVKNALKKLIIKEKPEIAYLLHHQNKLSPSVIDACYELKVPIVLRISDFSLACPSNNFLRNSEVCELCTNSLINSIKYKCVKNSFFGSLVKATALKYYRLTKIYEKSNAIIFPSYFTLNKLKFLFKRPELIYLPTFVKTQFELKEGKKKTNEKYALFVGRIEEEKGILYAIKAFEKIQNEKNETEKNKIVKNEKKRNKKLNNFNYKLKIVGKSHSGYIKELINYVEKNNIKNVEFLGEKTQDELSNLYKNASFLIMPNIWYENMPNVVLEAFSFKKPVVASNIGSMREIVIDNYNGFLVNPKDYDAIYEKALLLFEDDKLNKKLGKNAYNDSIEKYNPETHYNKLIDIFNNVVIKKN